MNAKKFFRGGEIEKLDQHKEEDPFNYWSVSSCKPHKFHAACRNGQDGWKSSSSMAGPFRVWPRKKKAFLFWERRGKRSQQVAKETSDLNGLIGRPKILLAYCDNENDSTKGGENARLWCWKDDHNARNLYQQSAKVLLFFNSREQCDLIDRRKTHVASPPQSFFDFSIFHLTRSPPSAVEKKPMQHKN